MLNYSFPRKYEVSAAQTSLFAYFRRTEVKARRARSASHARGKGLGASLDEKKRGRFGAEQLEQ